MNLKEIKELINLMNENGLVELEIEKDGTSIRLRKIASEGEVSSAPVVIERVRRPETMAQEPAETAEKIAAKTVEIKAPMVGTFYRAPSP